MKLNSLQGELNFVQGDMTPAELFDGSLEPSWTAFLTLDSSWIVCRMILLWLNCQLNDLNVTEIFLDSNWTVYRVTWLKLNIL